MTLLNLKKAIYSFVGRSIGTDTTDGDLIENSVDLCLLAINQARLKAQREHDFKALESLYGASISKYGTSYDAFTTYPGGGSTVSMRKITGVYKYSLSGSNQIALGERYDMQSPSELDRVAGRSLENENIFAPTSRTFCYAFGRKLYMFNADATLVAVKGIAILADLTNTGFSSESTDFFVVHGHDWLLYQSLRQLQFMVKEDLRIPNTDVARADAWQSLLKVDGDFESNWTDLD